MVVSLALSVVLYTHCGLVEYPAISAFAERDIFQRVQLGVQLSAAGEQGYLLFHLREILNGDLKKNCRLLIRLYLDGLPHWIQNMCKTTLQKTMILG